METTEDRLLQLAALRDQAGQTTFDRVMLARFIFTDVAWIADRWSGNRHAAADHLGEAYLADLLAGGLTFYQLMKIAEEFASVDAWKSVRFRLPALWVKLQQQEKSRNHDTFRLPSKPSPRVAVVEYENAMDQVAELEREIHAAEEKSELLRRENQSLRDKVQQIAATEQPTASARMKKPRTEQGGMPRKPGHLYVVRRPGEEDGGVPRMDYEAVITTCSPGDAAELVMGLVERAADPWAVAQILLAKLPYVERMKSVAMN